jgi:hypothetical protein
VGVCVVVAMLSVCVPSGTAAQRGVGPVRLNEQLTAERALGAGKLLGRGTSFGYSYANYCYHSGSVAAAEARGLISGAACSGATS